MQYWARLTAVVIFLLLGTIGANCSDVRLKSGSQYDDVKILGLTSTRLIISTKFGNVDLPLASVLAIDGKRLGSMGTTAPTAVPTPVPTVEPTLAPTPVPEIATPEPTPVPVTPAPTPQVTPEPTPEQVFSTPSQEHAGGGMVYDPHMDYVLAAMVGSVLIWLGQLVWVQQHQNSRKKVATGWNTIVLLLPGVGLILYLVSSLLDRKPKVAPLPGGGSDFADAAGKKRKLFGSAEPARPKGQGIGLRFVDEQNQPVPIKNEAGDKPTLELAREILEAAVVQRASDIHIEPQEEEWRVRLRVDGQLAELQMLKLAEGKRLVTALKSLAQIDVAEKRRAQDGRFRVRTELRDVDFRVATANSIFGEKVVIRILDRKGGLFSLDQVGMSAEMEATYDRAIHSRAGMIIVTGPTGSGKTSTLYAGLSRLDREKLNVMTIEDPVEYELPGATQIPVLPKAGVTYESGLRSILRQDPDVILIGEMRDAEAATVALRAALTGHLVFTSLHTRDTISTLVRLEEMGLDRTQISSALLMLVAQRLVRVLCPACRKPVPCHGEELAEIGLGMPVGETIWEPGGCPACDGIGYRGRTAIFELLVLNDEIRNAVAEGASHDLLYEMARKNGFRMYREDGARKILSGITSVAEVLEAT